MRHIATQITPETADTALKETSGQVGATTEELELAKLMVAALNLEVAPSEIDAEAPLYREGLGLDSIDILELSLAISKAYGVKLRSDDENNTKIFSSLRSLNNHIEAHRAR